MRHAWDVLLITSIEFPATVHHGTNARNENKGYLQTYGIWNNPCAIATDAGTLSLEFISHRAGELNGSSSSHNQPALRCNCSAKLKLHIKESDPTTIVIEYDWRHTGHEVCWRNDLITAPGGRRARQLLEKMVDSKMSWVAIEHALRVDKNQLQRIKASKYRELPAIKQIPYSMHVDSGPSHYDDDKGDI
ncbi:hypothetical protein BDB00DRAFT_871061 [Zychaea mexicana]|uniref:uncharacterized protein n=1 Tax=Zychaea mexicana TaxID=64656 RepID=UPI0022FEFC92|nr:uncharacterized protein BDB00DRAFT_871061 [Zychaea mexicana]KAI9494787.1 hypothetical protein BDB00DRAFT_871061 [Zychaea mexicana]